MNTASDSLRFEPIIKLPAVQAVCELAPSEVFLVGGAVRDFMWDQTLSTDLDFMVFNGQSERLARQVAEALGAAFVPLDPEFGIYRVVDTVSGQQLDFANAQGTLEQDLGRRDLTINALGLNLQTGELLDLFGGLADLRERKIRMLSLSNLREDPLRLLRIFRFAAQFNAQIHPETLAVVKAHGQDILAVAAERIQYELLRLVSMPSAFAAIQTMTDIGLLEILFPEFTPMRDIPPNGHHHLMLLDHTLALVQQAEALYDELDKDWQAYFTESLTPAVNRMGIIKLACLFHDLGKPATKADKTTPTGIRYTYYGHDQVSETMTAEICARLKLSGNLTDRVKHLVRWHLYPCQFGQTSSRKSLLRFYRRMGELTPDILLLALADRFSTLGEGITPAVLEQSKVNHWWLLAQYRQEQAVLKEPGLLDGNAVMRLLNIKPGKKVGEILEALLEAQQLGDIRSVEEAQAWVQKNHAGV